MLTNSVTAGVMAFTGDVIAQYIERSAKRGRLAATAHEHSAGSGASANRDGDGDGVTEPERLQWSVGRSLTLLTWGCTMSGPPMVAWYNFLHRLGGTPLTLPKVRSNRARFTHRQSFRVRLHRRIMPPAHASAPTRTPIALCSSSNSRRCHLCPVAEGRSVSGGAPTCRQFFSSSPT